MSGRRDLGRLQGEIHELFADLWQVSRLAGFGHGFRPPTDCFRTEDPPELVIVIELAGMDPQHIQVVSVGDVLIVHGERNRPRLPQRPSFRQMEIDYGPFQRRIHLDEDVDATRAKATYDRGFLRVVLPVTRKPRRSLKATIEVTTRS